MANSPDDKEGGTRRRKERLSRVARSWRRIPNALAITGLEQYDFTDYRKSLYSQERITQWVKESLETIIAFGKGDPSIRAQLLAAARELQKHNSEHDSRKRPGRPTEWGTKRYERLLTRYAHSLLIGSRRDDAIEVLAAYESTIGPRQVSFREIEEKISAARRDKKVHLPRDIRWVLSGSRPPKKDSRQKP